MAENVLWLALWFLRLVQGNQDSWESDPLQQALLLVDLLKAEYAKVRKENQILRQRELQTQSYVDDRTCPTTLSSEDVIQPGGRRAYFAPGNSLTPRPYVARRHPYKSRRQEYDDAFGPHPGGGDPTKATTDISTTKKQTTTTNQTSTSGTDATKSTRTQQSKKISPDSFTKIGSSSSKKSSGMKKVPLNYKKTTKKVRDPIMEQVASEIINEMDEAKSSTMNNKLAFYSAPLWSGKTEKNTRFEHFFKGTLKIHQATSKRYPLPLPENNAFCFFNPDSSLCRTFI